MKTSAVALLGLATMAMASYEHAPAGHNIQAAPEMNTMAAEEDCDDEDEENVEDDEEEVPVAMSAQKAVQYTTSTIYGTSISTVIGCAASVTDCPASSTILKQVQVAMTTTVCPVEEAGATHAPGAPHAPHAPANGNLPANGNVPGIVAHEPLMTAPGSGPAPSAHPNVANMPMPSGSGVMPPKPSAPAGMAPPAGMASGAGAHPMAPAASGSGGMPKAPAGMAPPAGVAPPAGMASGTGVHPMAPAASAPGGGMPQAPAGQLAMPGLIEDDEACDSDSAENGQASSPHMAPAKPAPAMSTVGTVGTVSRPSPTGTHAAMVTAGAAQIRVGGALAAAALVAVLL